MQDPLPLLTIYFTKTISQFFSSTQIYILAKIIILRYFFKTTKELCIFDKAAVCHLHSFWS